MNTIRGVNSPMHHQLSKELHFFGNFNLLKSVESIGNLWEEEVKRTMGKNYLQENS